LEDVLKNFPQWVSPRLGEFSNHVQDLPFDQHWLIALCAPRAFIAADALDDAACNGNALKESYLAAKPVYEFLGVPQKLGIHFRPGKHALAEEDWQAILDFADQQLMGKKTAQRFDEFPADELLH
jgi:endo-1,4-beta-xylanase